MTVKVASRLAGLSLALNALAFATGAAAAPIAPGSSEQSAAIGGKTMAISLFRPDCPDPSLLVVLHGVGRDAARYRDHAKPLAERLCMIVLAPLFDKKNFPTWRYQRGGVEKGGVIQPERNWTGHLIPELVEWARKQEGKPLPYSLVGHSAGGQFLSRVAAYIPTQAKRIVIANPSSYVLATTDVRAPFGLGGLYSKEKAETELKRYLALPVTIYLGHEDTGDENLGQTPEAKAQGKTRYDRGLFAFNTAKNTAQAKGLTFNWRLVEIPGVGHNARKMFSSKQAAEAFAP